MFNFLGIQFGNLGYRLQQIVPDTDGKPVQKTSDILFWVAADVGNGTLYVPISKIDIEMNTTVVPAQLLACYNDRTRTLLQKTPKGTATIPSGAIFCRRCR